MIDPTVPPSDLLRLMIADHASKRRVRASMRVTSLFTSSNNSGLSILRRFRKAPYRMTRQVNLRNYRKAIGCPSGLTDQRQDRHW